MKEIISANNEIIKEVFKCKNKESYRRKQGLVIVEGKRQIKFALNNLELIHYFYCSEIEKSEKPLDYDEKLIIASEKVFNKLSFKNNPDGHLAIFKAKEYSLEEIELSTKPLIIVLDKVEKPGNLGAVARTAVSAKVDAIILTDQEVDVYNPNVISSSTGHSLNIKIISTSQKEAIKYLKDKKINIYTTSIEASNSYLKSDLNSACALVFGAEDKGLDEGWLKASDQNIIIPMLENIDSLNVSVSVAIITYEALRQRKVIDF